ncbi:uncharacterized protein LOC130614416 [Hydractinia symbiolongicarpus]|uniref:uncharacterized protein LOC130614416 n=1 Tax=Hydractinia symbiolongicarpus TaxID=13093 RepID=UPI00254BD123|nr:uncharacterized protein LOC130614416 [Hydractinia symbiolongicarpus]XP_057291826.1 uncharacterized protein LOC130614416 [Hydractinia symbiolongicarpus]XP_057291827.1 uncharacterized protein LOC130614416 [Hydractinia symbiolongicarpus]
MVTCLLRRNVSMVKNLGIIQMANGIVILILGSSASFKFREEVWINEKSVISIGLLRICIAGVFGSLFTLKHNNSGLNCTHMVFCLLFSRLTRPYKSFRYLQFYILLLYFTCKI